MTSRAEANADAAQDQLETWFEDWKTDANLDEVFPSLDQVRRELGSENGRIGLCSRLSDNIEAWLEDQ